MIQIDPALLEKVDELRAVARTKWDAVKAATNEAQVADAKAQNALDEAIGLVGHVLAFEQRVVGYVRAPKSHSRRLLVKRVRIVRDGLQAEGKSVGKAGEVGTMVLQCYLADAEDMGTLEQFKGAK